MCPDGAITGWLVAFGLAGFIIGIITSIWQSGRYDDQRIETELFYHRERAFKLEEIKDGN